LSALPDSVLQKEVSDLRQVVRPQVKSPFGVREARWRALPVVLLNAKRREEMLRGILFDVFAGRHSEDVREQLCGTAVVSEDGAGLVRHRAVNGELHPGGARLHQARRV